jgi:hypothetical protein
MEYGEYLLLGIVLAMVFGATLILKAFDAYYERGNTAMRFE